MASARENVKGVVRLTILVAIGFWAYSLVGESDESRKAREAREAQEHAAFLAEEAKKPTEQRLKDGLVRAFGEGVAVDIAGDQIRVARNSKVGDWLMFSEAGEDLGRFIKASRRDRLPVEGRWLVLDTRVQAMDKFGRDVGWVTAATGWWSTEDLMKVPDDRVFVALDLASKVTVMPLARDDAKDFCTEGRLHSAPKRYCAKAVGGVVEKR